MASAVVPNRRSVAEAMADPQNLPSNIAAIGDLLTEPAYTSRRSTGHPGTPKSCGGRYGNCCCQHHEGDLGVHNPPVVGHPLDNNILCIEGELMSSGQCNISVARTEDFNVITETAVYSPEEARTEFEAHPNKEKLDPIAIAWL